MLSNSYLILDILVIEHFREYRVPSSCRMLVLVVLCSDQRILVF